MIYYLLMCPTLTAAQRAGRALNGLNIPGAVIRAPGGASVHGCAWCVKVPERYLSDALSALERRGLAPRRVYMMYPDGTLTEVPL